MACLNVIKRKKLSCSSQVTLFRCISLWVYPGIFYLVPFRQPSPPTRFPLITAIGMCHLLPVHHFGMASFAGSKVKIQQKLKNTVRPSIYTGLSTKEMEVCLWEGRYIMGNANGLDLDLNTGHLFHLLSQYSLRHKHSRAQLVGAAEYTNCNGIRLLQRVSCWWR